MKSRPFILLLLVAMLPGAHATADIQDLTQHSRDIIETFSGRLQQALKQALAAGGPVEAIEVCRVQAPRIAADLSGDGWIVRRTSLKVRNPLNAPDAFEKRVLQDFAEKKAAGWAIEKLAYYKMAEQGETSEFRYMKAIPTKPLCLTCHGENIAPPVRKKLDAAYPDDAARGYAAGDIRGAFSLRKRFQTSPAEAGYRQVEANDTGPRLTSRR